MQSEKIFITIHFNLLYISANFRGLWLHLTLMKSLIHLTDRRQIKLQMEINCISLLSLDLRPFCNIIKSCLNDHYLQVSLYLAELFRKNNYFRYLVFFYIEKQYELLRNNSDMSGNFEPIEIWQPWSSVCPVDYIFSTTY